MITEANALAAAGIPVVTITVGADADTAVGRHFAVKLGEFVAPVVKPFVGSVPPGGVVPTWTVSGKDLVTLMQIRQRAALAPSAAVASTSDEALNALTLLLKQQVAALERERAARQRDLALEHGLPEGVSAHAQSLQVHLQKQVQMLEARVCDLQAALAQAGDVAGLKRWLNRQMD